MTRKIALGFIAGLLALALAVPTLAEEPAAPEAKKFGPNVGDYMKSFTVDDPIEGTKVTLENLLKAGKDTCLIFMQTACSLCIEEINNAVGAHGDVKEALNILLVSVDLDPKRLKPYKEAYNLPFPILHDGDASVLSSLGLGATPAMVVIDKEGKIKTKIAGYDRAQVKGVFKGYAKR